MRLVFNDIPLLEIEHGQVVDLVSDEGITQNSKYVIFLLKREKAA